MPLLIGKQLLKCEADGNPVGNGDYRQRRESYCTFFNFHKNEENTTLLPSIKFKEKN